MDHFCVGYEIDHTVTTTIFVILFQEEQQGHTSTYMMDYITNKKDYLDLFAHYTRVDTSYTRKRDGAKKGML